MKKLLLFSIIFLISIGGALAVTTDYITLFYGNNLINPGTTYSVKNDNQTTLSIVNGYFFNQTLENRLINTTPISQVSKANSYTISLWLNGQFSGTDGILANRINATDYIYIESATSGAQVRVGIRNDAGTGWLATKSHDTALNTSQWYNLVVTWNTSTLNFYIDGIAQTGSTGPNPAGSDGFSIGASPQDAYYFGNQYTKNVKIFDRVLNSTEITALYDEGNAGTCAPIESGKYQNNLITDLTLCNHNYSVQGLTAGVDYNNGTIYINQDGLTLDLNGATITSNNTGTGVLFGVHGKDNVILKNGALNNFDNAINSYGSTVGEVENFTIYNITIDGCNNGGSYDFACIYGQASTWNITDVTINDAYSDAVPGSGLPGHGLYFALDTGARLGNNIFIDNLQVTGSNASCLQTNGVVTSNSFNNTVIQNSRFSNCNTGINANGLRDSIVKDSNLTNLQTGGINIGHTDNGTGNLNVNYTRLTFDNVGSYNFRIWDVINNTRIINATDTSGTGIINHRIYEVNNLIVDAYNGNYLNYTYSSTSCAQNSWIYFNYTTESKTFTVNNCTIEISTANNLTLYNVTGDEVIVNNVTSYTLNLLDDEQYIISLTESAPVPTPSSSVTCSADELAVLGLVFMVILFGLAFTMYSVFTGNITLSVVFITVLAVLFLIMIIPDIHGYIVGVCS